MEKILFKDECFAIQGAIFAVYREIGSGFLEAVYQECLEMEFQNRSIPFAAKKGLSICYRGIPLNQVYRPDFVCFGQIIVELKAVREIAPEHKAQLLNYLKITKIELGLLVNFCAFPNVDIVRMAGSHFLRAER